jgi:hypothetical protein
MVVWLLVCGSNGNGPTLGSYPTGRAYAHSEQAALLQSISFSFLFLKEQIKGIIIISLPHSTLGE